MEKWELAFEDWKRGMKYQEIADKYSVSVNTVKSWKTRFWNKAQRKKCAENVSKSVQENKKSVQLKTKAGAPKGNKNAINNKGGGAPEGNQNAVGNKGGSAPKGNKNSLKHGIYEKLLYSAFSEEEKELFHLKELDEAEELKGIIRLCDIQIFRFMQKVKEVQEKPGGLLADRVIVTNRKCYDKDTDKMKLSDSTTATNAIAAHNLIVRYNDEIERIKKTKIRCLEDLRRIKENTPDEASTETKIQIYIPQNTR